MKRAAYREHLLAAGGAVQVDRGIGAEADFGPILLDPHAGAVEVRRDLLVPARQQPRRLLLRARLLLAASPRGGGGVHHGLHAGEEHLVVLLDGVGHDRRRVVEVRVAPALLLLVGAKEIGKKARHLGVVELVAVRATAITFFFLDEFCKLQADAQLNSGEIVGQRVVIKQQKGLGIDLPGLERMLKLREAGLLEEGGEVRSRVFCWRHRALVEQNLLCELIIRLRKGLFLEQHVQSLKFVHNRC